MQKVGICRDGGLDQTLLHAMAQNGLDCGGALVYRGTDTREIYKIKKIQVHTVIKTTMRYAHLERGVVSRRAVMVLDAYQN